MPKIDLAAAPRRIGTGYPEPYAEPCRRRDFTKLSEAAGLTRIGVNLLTLPDGQWSGQRHWHEDEDEFVFVVSGDVVLVDDHGETPLTAGDCVAFPAGEANGHHIQNRSGRDAVLLQVSNAENPATQAVDYPDIDMVLKPGNPAYLRRDGTPW